jgi:hypothetical protein
MKKIYYLVCATVFLLISNVILCQGDIKTDKKTSKGSMPLGWEWAKNKGITLPSKYGVSLFYTYMTRDVKVTDVTVEILDQEPQSISDFSTFAVKNKTSIAAIKLDTWILPVLNLYVLAGYGNTDANLNANFTIDRILPLPPVDIEIQTITKVKGPYLGIGTTLVGGYRNWFIMADANYGETWPDKLNNSINVTMLSGRTGFSANIGDYHSLKAWVGAMYMDSKCTLEIKAPTDELGDVLVRVYQHPENPWTMQCGFMLSLNQRFDIMTELGTNFKDASISVLTASFRF